MRQTSILYISEDYPYSKVHHELCRHICEQDRNITILMYCVTRKEIQTIDLRGYYKDINYKTLFYGFDGNEWRYKFDFSYKIRKKYTWLAENCDLSTITLTHAATLFSDGSIALRLYKEYKIPYMVSVRGTDMNLYFKFMPHLWKLGLEILRNAQKIFFITERSFHQLFDNRILLKLKETIRSKYVILPNGIDWFWIANASTHKKHTAPLKLLYIGIFDKNKNVASLQKAVVGLRKHIPGLRLTLIGGGGTCHEQVLKYCRKYPDVFEYKGKIYDKDALLEIIREHDIFVMVSHSETFGLVYVEALSQGLPVLYSAGQGIDGVFSQRIGEAVDSHDMADIARGLRKMILNYDDYQCVDDIARFSWETVANQYIAQLHSDTNL